MPITTPILPASQQIDWSQCGIPGGIPSAEWTQSGATILASAYNNGAADATAGIQAAINAAASNTFVLLGPGIFLINSSLAMKSGVVLRGAGPASLGGSNQVAAGSYTVLNTMGSANGVINFGNGSNWPGSPPRNGLVSITGGASQGQSVLSVASTSTFSVGSIALITQLNDSSFVTDVGNEGTTSSDNIYGNTRLMGQTSVVTAIGMGTITINPPLFYSYTLTPAVTSVTSSCSNCGVEDLTIFANNTGYGASISMLECNYCWVLNVESNFTDGDWIDMEICCRNEVRHCNFHDAYLHGPGTHDSCIDMYGKTSGTLIVDNICYRGHVSIMCEEGASGNVIAYNWCAGNYDTENSPVTGYLVSGLNTHQPHPFMNLYEGNITTNAHWDDVWGSSSHGVLLRNWITGAALMLPPYTTTTRTGQFPFQDSTTTPGVWSYQAVQAANFEINSTTYSMIGNVMGSQALVTEVLSNGTGSPLPCSPMVIWPATRSYDTNTYCYSFGYQSTSDDGSLSGDNAVPYTTAIIAGDYNFGTGTNSGIVWHNATAQAIPNSLFLTAAPNWFGNLAWPPISPASPPQTNTPTSTIIPAGYRFVNGTDPPGMGGLTVINATVALK